MRPRAWVVVLIAAHVAVLAGAALLWAEARQKEKGEAPTGTAAKGAESQRGEVEKAYLRFWDAWAEANLKLDPGLLEAVAVNPALRGLRSQIETQRRNNQPVRIEVEHDYRIVFSPDGNREVATAQVEDRYLNHTVRVDPQSGEVIEEDPNELVQAIFVLKRIGGVWKVAEIIERGSSTHPRTGPP